MSGLRSWYLITMAFAALSAGPAAQAQVKAESPQPVMTCPVAARVLAHAHPANLVAPALRYMIGYGCEGEAPSAVAATMRQLHSSTDTAALGALVSSATVVRDADFFSAALEMARDTAATPQARAAGFLVSAIELTDKMEFDYHYLVTEPNVMICPLVAVDHSLRIQAGAPLPSDARTRVRDAAGAVTRADQNAVRVAASCATIVLRVLAETGG